MITMTGAKKLATRAVISARLPAALLRHREERRHRDRAVARAAPERLRHDRAVEAHQDERVRSDPLATIREHVLDRRQVRLGHRLPEREVERDDA